MTELKLATEATTPVEKIVEEVKVPAVEAPKTDNNNAAKPVEVTPVVEKIVTTA